jgi:hypothetical protein
MQIVTLDCRTDDPAGAAWSLLSRLQLARRLYALRLAWQRAACSRGSGNNGTESHAKAGGDGRVSTRDQNPDGQRDALVAAGCDKVPGGQDQRPAGPPARPRPSAARGPSRGDQWWSPSSTVSVARWNT